MARFPLSEHIVSAESSVSAPKYIIDKPKTNLTMVLRNNKHETYEAVDVIKHWPNQPSSDLDASQLAALKRVLTKRLAIVQGPPGTGKTHVSVEAIKIMLANRTSSDPPIIIACQTNHAVDQILRHIARFEPDFIRLGGRSKDKDIIKKRTLYEVKKECEGSLPRLSGCLKPNARKKMNALEKEIALLLTPLKPTKTPMDFRMLERMGLLTEKQANTLEAGASQWVQDERLVEPRKSPFHVWMAKSLTSVPPKQEAEEYGFDFEEADLAFEQLRELEAENMAKDDDDFESLHGITYPLADNYTYKKPTGVTEIKLRETAINALKHHEDMWKIPEPARGAVYRYLQAEMKAKILKEVQPKAEEFNALAKDRRTGLWEEHEQILKTQKVIGMTTTGFSKYRGLLHALQPKTILIEEAAETLEAPVTVACLASLQHLILVGDHKQLRPHCHVKAHEDKPYYFNISLFERMVNNNVEYSTLSKQRRMIPEIRRILYPIYGDLITDHASVTNPEHRPNVPGMGGVNSFFFTHQWPEQRDDHMSALNQDEAEMIVGFVEYLHYNGVPAEDITVLTFYNGQRKRILSLLRQSVILGGSRFNVVTVDSYQGEENKIVVLSLVRSNDKGQIGFLGIDNRVCVALSRAQCGFYIFGNGQLLFEYKLSKTWNKVLSIIAGKKRKHERPKIEPVSRLDEAFPIRCSNHNQLTLVRGPSEWENLVGGCSKKCDGSLPCGHACQLNCHPFDHDILNCQQPCGKSLPCGHGECEKLCGELCECEKCSKPPKTVAPISNVVFDGQERLSPHASSGSNASSWKNFAQQEPTRYASAVAAANAERVLSREQSPQKKLEVEAELLLDFDDERNIYKEAEIVESLKGVDLGTDGTGERKAEEGKSMQPEADGAKGPTVSKERKGGHERDWSKERMSLLDL